MKSPYSISNWENFQKEIQAKPTIDLVDCEKLASHILKPITSSFNSKLREDEVALVMRVELVNLLYVINIIMDVANSKEPIKFISSDRDRLEFIKAEKQMKITNSEVDVKTAITVSIVRYILTNGSVNQDFKLSGKLPTIGFLSSRQSKGNLWYNMYVNNLFKTIKVIFKKSDYNIDFVRQYLFTNLVLYMNSQYPSLFFQLPDESFHVCIVRNSVLMNEKIKKYHDTNDNSSDIKFNSLDSIIKDIENS